MLLRPVIPRIVVSATPARSADAITRGQETVGACIDVATITVQDEARFADNRVVAASSIGVETLGGSVMLSGLATSSQDRSAAESMASRFDGVKRVKHEMPVRPQVGTTMHRDAPGSPPPGGPLPACASEVGIRVAVRTHPEG